DGNQVGFSRYRVRVDVPPDPSSAGIYTVTHPFGVSQFEVTDVGTGIRAINSTQDCLHTQNAQGVIVPTCGPPPVWNSFTTPRDPTVSLISRYLSWDPAESAPPQGYLGNPLIPHTITGSPCGTNFFRVEGPGMPPDGVETNLFTLMGKRVEICGNGYLDVNEQCDDGNTANGDCCSSTCQFESADTSCDDGNPCTDNATCDGAGTCPVTGFNTSGCDDGSACTTSDRCAEGICVGGPAPDCEDSNECTDDSCDPASGCQHSSNTSSCDDGNACTTTDTCSAGSCAGGPPPSCDDGNPCTEDRCSPSEGCTHTPLLDGMAC